MVKQLFSKIWKNAVFCNKISETNSINLSSIDKIIQHYIKEHIISFLDINDVIVTDHHGALKGHSTQSALASIHHTINHHYYNNNYKKLRAVKILEMWRIIQLSILVVLNWVPSVEIFCEI